jgi:serine/threonine protein phosphatase PrpC
VPIRSTQLPENTTNQISPSEIVAAPQAPKTPPSTQSQPIPIHQIHINPIQLQPQRYSYQEPSPDQPIRRTPYTPSNSNSLSKRKLELESLDLSKEKTEPRGHHHWHTKLITDTTKADVKMDRNLREKACKEHRDLDPIAPWAADEDLPSLEEINQQKPVQLQLCFHQLSDLGLSRKNQEDAHFVSENGALAGIFDGHGGSDVSNYANENFPKRFPDVLKNCNGNVHQAFETLIHEIHEEVAQLPDWQEQGTTAVISYLDKTTNKLYTATLADSEANIYRKNKKGENISIPLSPIRNWSSVKDAKRASLALEWGEIATEWPKKAKNSKTLRYITINVSRGIGDDFLCKLNSLKEVELPSGMSHKPKITMTQLKPGDILVLACDGLKDYVNETKIVSIVSENEDLSLIAEKLKDAAISNMRFNGGDNVTIIVIKASSIVPT